MHGRYMMVTVVHSIHRAARHDALLSNNGIEINHLNLATGDGANGGSSSHLCMPRGFRFGFETSQIRAHVVSQATDDATANVQ